jgi:hypothetical protein
MKGKQVFNLLPFFSSIDRISIYQRISESPSSYKFYIGTTVGRKKFYRAGVASSGGGLKFLELFGYFLFQDKK